MARIGLQTERVSQKRKDADLEEQKVDKPKLEDLRCIFTEYQDGALIFPYYI